MVWDPCSSIHPLSILTCRNSISRHAAARTISRLHINMPRTSQGMRFSCKGQACTPAGQSHCPVSALQLPTPLQSATQLLLPATGGSLCGSGLCRRACSHQLPKVPLHLVATSSPLAKTSSLGSSSICASCSGRAGSACHLALRMETCLLIAWLLASLGFEVKTCTETFLCHANTSTVRRLPRWLLNAVPHWLVSSSTLPRSRARHRKPAVLPAILI